MLVHRILAVLFSLFSISVFGQLVIDELEPLASKGNITDFDTYIEQTKNGLNSSLGESDDLSDLIEEAARSTALSHHSLFERGIVLFGDEVTNYLNTVKDGLLKDDPEFAQQVDVYTLRSTAPNAFAQLNGFVGVSIGLLARMQSEAQLAFVLSHELAHIEAQHIARQIEGSQDIDRLKSSRKDVTFDDVLRVRMKRNRSHEFAADSLGILRFKKSDYKGDESIRLLSVLGSSHLPIYNIPFDLSLFQGNAFEIPSSYWMDETEPIDPDKDESDIYQTHPNIKQRKDAIRSILERDEFTGDQLFIQPESEFQRVREIASLELIQNLTDNGNFAEACYTAYCMMQIHSDSERLSQAFATSLLFADRSQDQPEPGLCRTQLQ